MSDHWHLLGTNASQRAYSMIAGGLLIPSQRCGEPHCHASGHTACNAKTTDQESTSCTENERMGAEIAPKNGTLNGVNGIAVVMPSLRVSASQNNRVPNVYVGNKTAVEYFASSDNPLADIDRKLNEILGRVNELERQRGASWTIPGGDFSVEKIGVGGCSAIGGQTGEHVARAGRFGSHDLSLPEVAKQESNSVPIADVAGQFQRDESDAASLYQRIKDLEDELSKQTELVNQQTELANEQIGLVNHWKGVAEHLDIEKSILVDQLEESKVRAEQNLEESRVEVVNPHHPKIVALLSSVRMEAVRRERELKEDIARLQSIVSRFELEFENREREDLERGALQCESGESSGYEQELHRQLMEDMSIELESLRNEIAELKGANSELQQRNVELTKRIQNNGEQEVKTDGRDNGALSWEELKQTWLKQMEADEQDRNEPRILEIDEFIRTTDIEIDKRDLEIAELRHLLSEQTVATQGIAVGAAAIASHLELDGIIQAERERLKRLQEEWEQKQRQAEIEMSLERARLARERLELQEAIQSIEQKQMDFEYSNSVGTSAETVVDVRPRGRWLHRLGLREG